MCLKGTMSQDMYGSTPVVIYKEPVLRRSAFQAHLSVIVDPDTSCPVTVALLRSAFQALSINHALRREWNGDNVCLQLGKWAEVFCLAMRAWKALRSAATVTGDEVLGRTIRRRCAWNFRANESNQFWIAECRRKSQRRGTTPQDMLNFILHKISPKSNSISTICAFN